MGSVDVERASNPIEGRSTSEACGALPIKHGSQIVHGQDGISWDFIDHQSSGIVNKHASRLPLPFERWLTIIDRHTAKKCDRSGVDEKTFWHSARSKSFNLERKPVRCRWSIPQQDSHFRCVNNDRIEGKKERVLDDVQFVLVERQITANLVGHAEHGGGTQGRLEFAELNWKGFDHFTKLLKHFSPQSQKVCMD
jgi:hypothetical protein